MRTMQLTSYRDASTINRIVNADILTHHIRIAALDDRTCLACIALHGSRLRPDERIDDHWNGRCDSIPVVRGTNRVVESGESWLRSQPQARQRSIMGGANYEAWRANAVQLNEFVKPHEDDLFGEMVVENSLIGILGNAAQNYYMR